MKKNVQNNIIHSKKISDKEIALRLTELCIPKDSEPEHLVVMNIYNTFYKFIKDKA